MWSLNTIDQSELKLSCGNKFVDGWTDGQGNYYIVHLSKWGLIILISRKWCTRGTHLLSEGYFLKLKIVQPNIKQSL